MKTSESTDKIYPAIFALQQELEPFTRSKVVKTGKYEFRYAPLDAIMDGLKPLFNKNGLALLQSLDADALTSRLIHTSGQWVQSETFLNREHASMQGFGGEVTYKRRYALSALLGIVSDDDTDVPKITARGTLTDAMDGLSTRKQNMVTDVGEVIKEKFNAGQEIGAYEEYCAMTDQEERMALWGILPSNIRTAIKKMAEADRSK